MDLCKDFNVVCEYRKKVPGVSGNSVASDDNSVKVVIQSLDNIKEYLSLRFSGYKDVDFKFIASKGASIFPFVPYVVILPPGQKVSSGIYVVICFDKFGEGALVGCSESKTSPQGLKTVKRTSRGKTLRINVNGPKSNTQYNDVYSNPKEFYRGISSDDNLIAHIEESLNKALFALGHIKKEELTANNAIDIIEIDDFDPLNISDGREKILLEITKRRGQRRFRQSLLSEYGRCNVTGCEVFEALEAAHIISYNGAVTNHIQNGLLLRSDVHTLFDLGLISIDPQTHKISVVPSLKSSIYYEYNNQKVIKLIASYEALTYHFNNVYEPNRKSKS
jgi:putative restriction endonuclease